jgi:hypothetical protein
VRLAAVGENSALSILVEHARGAGPKKGCAAAFGPAKPLAIEERVMTEFG